MPATIEVDQPAASPVSGTPGSHAMDLDVQPSGLAEKAADLVNLPERSASRDLERFKFIEARGVATGADRESIEDGRPVERP